MRLAAALFMIGVVACSSTGGALRARFAKEQSCPEDRVRVVEAGANEYRASGCGRHVVYVCQASAGFGDPGSRCVEQGGAHPRTPPEADRRRLPPPDPRIQEPR